MSQLKRSALLNRESTENDFTSPRDALLHFTCCFLERLGFGNAAWDQRVFDLLDEAFDACVEAELTPEFVIIKLGDITSDSLPMDDPDELIDVIKEVLIAAAEQAKPSIPSVYRGR